MSTFNLTTSSTVTANRVRINLYKEPDRITVIDSLTVNSSGGIVPEKTWTFYNLLPSEGYLYRWVEIDSNGLTIQQYGSQNFTTPESGSIEVREPENVEVDDTPGFTNGTSSVIFNGTGGKPDFRGWTIIPFEIGTGGMKKDVMYTWEPLTGEFVRLDRTFEPNERYFIEFLPKKTVNNPPIVRNAWSGDIIVNDDIIFSPSEFGQNALIYGNDSFLKITLPNIFDVAPGKLLYIEHPTDAVAQCAEITCSSVTNNGNRIMWPKAGLNSIYTKPGETLAIYRQFVNNTISFWRIKYPDGNWKFLGEEVTEYTENTDIINKLALTDATYSNLDQARFYYMYILNLNPSQVVNFADWTTGDNKYKYSYADVNGNFHVPDLRNLYQRSSGANAAGKYLKNQNLRHNHGIATTNGDRTGNLNADPIRGTVAGQPNNRGQELLGAINDSQFDNYTIKGSGGDEARPETYVSNLYVRC